MANILITGARAPVALELARNFSRDGHSVYMADSLRFALAKFSSSVNKTFNIAAPRTSLNQFKNDLENILIEYNIDLLIPTCEEAFYVSAIKPSLEIHAKVFCPEFDLMKIFHSKYQIYSAAQGTGFKNPSTQIITGEELLSRKQYKGKVIKKEFCRFGTQVLIEPDFNDVSNFVARHLDEKFVIQDKIEGVEYCTYAIANNGKVFFDSIYIPKHRVGMAAGIYFEPVVNNHISMAIKQFCEINNVTGQIGFDVIVNEQGIFLLECNPRATSGLHLLSENSLSQAFLNSEYRVKPENKLSEPKMVKLAMLLIGLPITLNTSQFKLFKSDYRKAVDVVSIRNDRWLIFFSLLSLVEICVISIKTKSSLRAASTFDIEWDGEELDE